MTSDASLPETSPRVRPIIGGLWGWLARARWRRAARRMPEAEIDELRKRVVIISRQLDGLPISSRVQARRMELLRDKERCQTIVAEWERLHELGRTG